MARRTRSIKPEILEDEKTAGLSHLEWRLFVGSWIVADDYGNLRADPDYLRGQIVWSSRETRETVATALERLASVALLTPYSVRGQTYFHVTSWDKHQRIDRPSRPSMPGPDSADPAETTYESETLARPSRDPRETLAPDLEGEGEGEGEYPRSAAKRSRSHRLAPDWVPERGDANERAEQEAKARGVDLRVELAKLRDWAASKAAKRSDWNAVWRNWTRNAKAEYRSGQPQSRQQRLVPIGQTDDEPDLSSYPKVLP